MAKRKPKMKVTSHFRLAEEAAHEAFQLAMHHAIDAGEEQGRKRIQSNAARRGYNLDSSDLTSHVGPREGVLVLGAGGDEWWWRFFEFGTVYIPAMPSLRPGYLKARRVLLSELDTDFEGWVNKRAGIKGAKAKR